jgi:hypothetical protein
MRGYDDFRLVPVPRARADDILTAAFCADHCGKDNSAYCRSTPRSSKS